MHMLILLSSLCCLLEEILATLHELSGATVVILVIIDSKAELHIHSSSLRPDRSQG